MSVYVVAGMLVIVALLVGHVVAAAAFRRHIARLGQQLAGPDAQPVATVRRERLPDCVARFADRAGADPAARPATVWLRQSARLRMAPDKPWMPIGGEQVISLARPGFVWQAERRSGPLCLIRILDAFVNGRGELQARLFGSLPVARQTGPDLDRGELLRYLAELAWAPDAVWNNPALRWRELDDTSVAVSASAGATSATVRLYFNAACDLIEIQADARSSSERGVVVARPWRGRFSEHDDLGGRRIPLAGEVGYVYDDGYAAYWQGRITAYRLR